MLYVIGLPVLLPYLNSLSVRFFTGIMGLCQEKTYEKTCKDG